MELPGIPVYSGASGAGKAAPATTNRPVTGMSAVSEPPDDVTIASEGKVQPTKTPAAGTKDNAPTQSKDTPVAPSQEPDSETPTKSPGKTLVGTKAATATTPPTAEKAPEAAPAGAATVTVTVYAGEASPTGTNSETPINYEGEMHAWNVNGEGDGEEDEPSVVVPSPPAWKKKPSENEEASASGAHSKNTATPTESPDTTSTENTSPGVAGIAGKDDESVVQQPCPTEDENTVIPEAGEEEPAVKAPTLISAIHIPTEEEGTGAPDDGITDQGPSAEVPSSADAKDASPVVGIDAGIVDDSITQDPCPLDEEETADTTTVAGTDDGEEAVPFGAASSPTDTKETASEAALTDTPPVEGDGEGKVDESSAEIPCPMDTEETAATPSHEETATGEEVGATEAALTAKNPVAKEDGAVKANAGLDNTTDDTTDISPIEPWSLDSYETPPFDDDPPAIETLPVVQTAVVGAPTFDMSHCILRFDAVTGEYALDKRRSRIRAAGGRPGWNHGFHHSSIRGLSDPPPCVTYTLQGKDE